MPRLKNKSKEGKKSNIPTSEFIDSFREYPCIWDRSCEDHKNAPLRAAKFKLLAEEFGVEVEEVRNKFQNLQDQMQKSIVNEEGRTGMGVADRKKKWTWHDKLEFMRVSLESRE